MPRRRICVRLRYSCGLLHHFAILPDNHREFESAVLSFDVVRSAAHGSLGASHEGGRLRSFVGGMSVLLHTPINFRTESISCTKEMASRFAGRPRLSHTI